MTALKNDILNLDVPRSYKIKLYNKKLYYYKNEYYLNYNIIINNKTHFLINDYLVDDKKLSGHVLFIYADQELNLLNDVKIDDRLWYNIKSNGEELTDLKNRSVKELKRLLIDDFIHGDLLRYYEIFNEWEVDNFIKMNLKQNKTPAHKKMILINDEIFIAFKNSHLDEKWRSFFIQKLRIKKLAELKNKIKKDD